MLVTLAIGPDGVLRRAKALGHAGSETAGSNPACAAVTVLLRSCFETVAQQDGLRPSGQAPSPGELEFSVGLYPPEAAERLRGITEFLLTGVSGVEREYPGKVHLIVEDERRASCRTRE